jgi:hypothetical protein
VISMGSDRCAHREENNTYFRACQAGYETQFGKRDQALCVSSVENPKPSEYEPFRTRKMVELGAPL